jgi:hypothetical protein
MDEPTFHIFMGTFDKDAEWVEAVAELSMARQRMEESRRPCLDDTSFSVSTAMRFSLEWTRESLL